MSDFRPVHAIHMQGHVGTVEYGSDDKMHVFFYRHSVHMPKKSEDEGRPIYEAEDFVSIQHPGERDCTKRPATDHDKARWPRHWAAYQEGREHTAVGTPLSVLFPSEPEIIDMMRALKVQTVEQLADLTEQGINRLGIGGRDRVERAKRFLDESKAAKPFHRLLSELADAKEQMRLMQEQIAALSAASERSRKPKD